MQRSSISAQVRASPNPRTSDELYLDLLKRTLTRVIVARGQERQTISPDRSWLRAGNQLVQRALRPLGLEIVRLTPKSLAKRKDAGEEERFRRFTREEIAASGENFDLSWLKDETEYSRDELSRAEVRRAPRDLLAVARRQLTRARTSWAAH